MRGGRALVAGDHSPELAGVRRFDRHQLQRRNPAHVALDAVHAGVKRRGMRRRFLGMHRVAHIGAKSVAVRIFPGDDSARREQCRADSYEDERQHRAEHQVASKAELHRTLPPRNRRRFAVTRSVPDAPASASVPSGGAHMPRHSSASRPCVSEKCCTRSGRSQRCPTAARCRRQTSRTRVIPASEAELPPPPTGLRAADARTPLRAHA